ncbi:MAG: Kae1-like domain-containing protein, partial [Candidatus Xenobia bacterium]
SFSGLKTAVLTYVRKHPETRLEDVCAGFQAAVVDVLVAKTVRAAGEVGAKTVVMAGGVACNSELRRKLREACRQAKIPLFYPSPLMCTDNAAMIACAGTWRLQAGRVSDLALDVDPGLPF